LPTRHSMRMRSGAGCLTATRSASERFTGRSLGRQVRRDRSSAAHGASARLAAV
jgi:hypothetical protein